MNEVLFHPYQYILLIWAVATAVFVTLFMIDDLFIDLYAFFYKLKPLALNEALKTEIQNVAEKKIAVLIANWKEFDVIERMIAGNVQNIQYDNYSFFIGVYPNDDLTWAAGRNLEIQFSNVHVIVNSVPGPTTKGQMLNEMTQKIISNTEGAPFDLFVLHDSEDLIHPYAFKLINYFSKNYCFLQIPVFSLPRKWNDWTGAIYCDEFSEAHSKDMLVRDHLGAGVPSAGVGTAFSLKLVQTLLKIQDGQLLRQDCLTEDYVLGLTAHRLNFKSKFLNFFLVENEKKSFIATREYFPSEFNASVRQKTRWTTGIAFQGKDILKWHGSISEKYFLWRDRRSFPNAVLILSSALLIPFFLMGLTDPFYSVLSYSSVFVYLTAINFFAMLWRLTQRARFSGLIYDWKFVTGLPVRWLLGNIINTTAAINSFQNYRNYQSTGKAIKWIKTTHTLPDDFGLNLDFKNSEKFRTRNSQTRNAEVIL